MKATGIVRKFDENGRFVLPMELRKTLNLEHANDALEIFVEGDSIILKKYRPFCIFCGESNELVTFCNKSVCKKCASGLNKIAKD